MGSSHRPVESLSWDKLERNIVHLQELHQLSELSTFKSLLQEHLIEFLTCLHSLQHRMHSEQVLHFLFFHMMLFQ